MERADANDRSAGVTIDGVRAGTGPATVSFAVKANPAPESRTTTIIAAGQVFTVTQSSCKYTVVPLILNFSAPGETRPVYVQTRAGCAWNPTVTAPFQIQTAVEGGGTPSGNGTLNVTVGANQGTAQSQ